MTLFASILKRTLPAAVLLNAACFTFPTGADGPLPIRTNLIASQGYVYGFPALLMDETMSLATEFPYICGLGGPANAFTHKFDPPDPDFRGVVRPNVDTLYSSAFLDLSEGPLRLEVPEVRDRFYMMAMLDAWSNNFAAPGTQTNGGEATDYLISGPNWQGDVPDGFELIRAPTDIVWIIGRTELKGAADLEAANALQRAYVLEPLNGEPPVRQEGECRPPADLATPEERVRALSGFEFFVALDRVLETSPPPTDDDDMLEKLGLIGVGPLAEISIADLGRRNRNALDDGASLGQTAMDRAFDIAQRASRWSPDPRQVPLGDYGTDYLIRGVVSQVGFGANQNRFATYQNTSRDDDGDNLTGEGGHSYQLIFEAGEAPPVNAFWSVTVYNSDGFLVENPINRYALGSNSGLEQAEDGDTVITFAAQQPEGTPEENWLPIPDTDFEVTLRMYWPEEPILNGDWEAPALERLD